MTDKKIDLFRKLHDIDYVYIDNNDKLSIEMSENFTGTLCNWYKCGGVQNEWNFKNGRCDGNHRLWDEDGNLISEAHYQ